MALSDSMAAYKDCYEFYDRAQSSANGIRIAVPDRPAAQYLRLRLTHARALERRESRRTFPSDDPRWDKSENDCFRVTFFPAAEGETGYWVYIQRWDKIAETAEIEEL